MNQEDGNYTIILRGRFAGKDRAVAKALSEVFGLSDAWGLQVVGGSPITLLAYMNANQAQAVYQHLLPVENAGCRFLVQQGLDRSIPAVSWKDDPVVGGKPLSEYLDATVAAAPVVPAAGGAPAAPAPVPGGAMLACPHCGKPVALQRGPGGPKLVPAALGPAPIPVPKPGGVALPAPVPIPIPGAQPPKQATPRAPARAVGPGGARPPQAPKLVPLPAPAIPRQLPVGPPDPPAPSFEPLDIDGLEELAPGAEPRVPLPDVPVVESELQPLTFPKAAKAPSGSDPRLNAPITLEDFEAGLGEFEPQDSETDLPSPEDVAGAVEEEVSSENVRQVRPSGRGRKASGGVPMGASAGTLDRVQKEDPDALCSIFIGKNNNPQVHELIAEIQGITVEEAQRLCQKVIVPVVKDIPISEADAIRERFREVNVNPRVTLKR